MCMCMSNVVLQWVLHLHLQDGGNGETATLSDVAWGDVLLCGGQSNMVFGMCATRNATQTAAEALDMIATTAAGGGIRLFNNHGKCTRMKKMGNAALQHCVSLL